MEIGIQEFGDLIIFHEQLVDLYSAHSDWENAIHHQKIIIATSQRKEWGLFDLGKLYLQMGNKKDAELSFTAAKNSIRTYPFRIQKIPAVVELDRHIEHQLKSLSTR